MVENIISITAVILLFGYIIYEKFVLPTVPPAQIEETKEVVDAAFDFAKKLEIIVTMASKFVILAKKQFADGNGTEKRKWVIEQLKNMSNKLGLVLSDADFEAINEGAYVEMKNTEK